MQEAAIEFSVARIAALFARNAPTGEIHKAIVAASIEIIAEPEGQGAYPPACRICGGDARTCGCSRAAKPARFFWPVAVQS